VLYATVDATIFYNEGRERGLAKLKEATNARRNAPNDTSYNEAMDRVCIAFDYSLAGDPELVWYRKCYSDFTHKDKIKRLTETVQSDNTSKRRRESSEGMPSGVSTSEACSTRRTTQPVNWDLCMFCHEPDGKQRLISVSTFNVSKNILKLSKLDNKMRVRLAGVNDLIAAEGKYHENCRNDYSYSTSKTKKESENTDIAFISLLCNELQYAAEKEQVLQLSDVWQRYQNIATETETSIPQSFFSRRTSFEEKLVERLGSLFEFVQPLERNKLEREPLLIPRKYSHDVLADYYYSTISNDDMLTMPTYQHDDDAFRSLIDVALQIRGDVIATPGREGLDVAEAAAIDCVPDRLYMFLNVLLGGQTLIDCDSETEGKGSAKLKTLILSLAQDIVYEVSEGKRWTPKDIGLASTLHQLTRSKHWVELFLRACGAHCQLQASGED
jgi:hypothetical protein